MLELRVLVVEDQPFQRGLLVNLFAAIEGVRVDSSGDALHAAALCELTRYDLVVSDLVMPGVDGIQFIQSLATQHHRPAVALLSSAAPPLIAAARLMAESLGLVVLGVQPKPIGGTDIAALVERLRHHLDGVVSEPVLDHSPVQATAEELLGAMKDNQITAWFQPKKSLQSGLVAAAEALVRWRHPTLGMLEPSRFLPLLADRELEGALLQHMLRSSIQAQARWRNAGFRIPVSINLPTHLLAQPDLPDTLSEITRELGGHPADVCFELMESSTTERVSDYYAGACRLRMKGFGLSQDDFGQGLSSVHALVSTPFTEVKIDRALVRGCARDAALHSAVSAVIALGNRLGLNIVAEGVETECELAALRRLGCDQVQGFLISRAVSAESFGMLLSKEGSAHGVLSPGR